METKTNQGALFVNDKKKTDNHPDYQGNLSVNNIEYYISGWKKKSKNGITYLSISIKEKNTTRQQQDNDIF